MQQAKNPNSATSAGVFGFLMGRLTNNWMPQAAAPRRNAPSQIAMPCGRLENDQRIHGRQRSAQSHQIKIIRNPSKFSSLKARLFEYK